VVVALPPGIAGLEVDPLIGAVVAVGVALLRRGFASGPKRTGVELPSWLVSCSARTGALGVVDELVVAAVAVGVGALLLELLLVVEEQHDRALVLRRGRVRPEPCEQGEDAKEESGVSSSQRSDCGRWR
jgi:hypothetical protein